MYGCAVVAAVAFWKGNRKRRMMLVESDCRKNGNGLCKVLIFKHL
jgi:hypothetical protein